MSTFSYSDMVNMICGGDIYPFLDLIQDSEYNVQDVQGSMPLGDAIQFLLNECERGNVELECKERYLSSLSSGRYSHDIDDEDPRKTFEAKFVLRHERVLLTVNEAGHGVWQWVARKCCGDYTVTGWSGELVETFFEEVILEVQIMETWSGSGEAALCWYAGAVKKACECRVIQELVSTPSSQEEGGYDDSLPF